MMTWPVGRSKLGTASLCGVASQTACVVGITLFTIITWYLCLPSPAAHRLLQLRVVICFFILVGARVVNVFVPIYYRNIVNALTPTSGHAGNHTHKLDAALGQTHDTTGVTFPLTSVLLYVFLRFLQVSHAH